MEASMEVLSAVLAQLFWLLLVCAAAAIVLDAMHPWDGKGGK